MADEIIKLLEYLAGNTVVQTAVVSYVVMYVLILVLSLIVFVVILRQFFKRRK